MRVGRKAMKVSGARGFYIPVGARGSPVIILKKTTKTKTGTKKKGGSKKRR